MMAQNAILLARKSLPTREISKMVANLMVDHVALSAKFSLCSATLATGEQVHRDL